jgi:hypothetical protein
LFSSFHILLLLFSCTEFLSRVAYWTIGFAGKLWQSFEGLSCNNEKLKVFHSDPFDYHSIMDALKGCCGLFYSFEPPSDQPTYDVCQLYILLLILVQERARTYGIIKKKQINKREREGDIRAMILIHKARLIGAGIHG